MRCTGSSSSRRAAKGLLAWRSALANDLRVQCARARPWRMPKPKYSVEQAAAIARAAGYEPKEDYPGRVMDWWKVRCMKCGAPRVKSLAQLQSGYHPCAHVRTRTATAEELDLPMAAVKAKYEAGATVRVLAKEYGVSYGTMHRRLNDVTTLRRRGGDPAWQAASSEEVRELEAEVVRLRTEENLLQETIAVRLGISPSRVSRILGRAGARRPRQRRQWSGLTF